MRRIGAGREAEVFLIDERRVLRRFYDTRPAEPEVRVMEHVRAAGMRVPEVYDVSGSEIVMERIRGMDMAADATRRPWRFVSHARALADLYAQLDRAPPLTGLEDPFGSNDAVVHLNLGPTNVMVTATGQCSSTGRMPAPGPVLSTWR